MPKSRRSSVAMRRSPCSWANQSSEASARSIGRSLYCRIQLAISSSADPLSSAMLRPPSDTHSRTRGAIAPGTSWQTSVSTGQVETKVPVCSRVAPRKLELLTIVRMGHSRLGSRLQDLSSRGCGPSDQGRARSGQAPGPQPAVCGTGRRWLWLKLCQATNVPDRLKTDLRQKRLETV